MYPDETGVYVVDFKGFSIIPDKEELIGVIKRNRLPSRVHNIEIFHDKEIITAITSRYGLSEKLNKNDPEYKYRLYIIFHQFLGFDAFHVPFRDEGFFKIPLNYLGDTASKETNRGQRTWTEEHRGPIQGWDDFERYPWPEIKKIDFSCLDWMEKNLPDNMGCYELTAHILEEVTFLLGYETLCMKIYDDPALVDAVCDKVGTFYAKLTENMCDYNCVPFIWASDDLGFKTSTLVSPDFLREKIFPWHKRCAGIAHNYGKPYLIHACGKLDAVMDDLIDYVGIDAKHSFEDTIIEVTDAYRLYHDRISILGGIDMDFLCRSDEKSIRERVRKTLGVCMEKGGYCLGTGNTVANYIPIDNYLAMVDEGRKYN
jgi:uroporphyrinogen decarboxylase